MQRRVCSSVIDSICAKFSSVLLRYAGKKQFSSILAKNESSSTQLLLRSYCSCKTSTGTMNLFQQKHNSLLLIAPKRFQSFNVETKVATNKRPSNKIDKLANPNNSTFYPAKHFTLDSSKNKSNPHHRSSFITSDQVLTVNYHYSLLTMAWDTASPSISGQKGIKNVNNCNNYGNNHNSYYDNKEKDYDVCFFCPSESTVKLCCSNDKESVANTVFWILETRRTVIKNYVNYLKYHKRQMPGDEKLDINNVYVILYPAHPFTKNSRLDKSLLMKELRMAISENQIILPKSVWEMVRAIFEKQVEIVKHAPLPPSLEHAYYELHGRKYSCLIKESLKVAATNNLSTGLITNNDDLEFEQTDTTKTAFSYKNNAERSSCSLLSMVLRQLEKPTAVRLAILAWDTMIKIFACFGTDGGKKRFTPTEHIIRSAIPVVNVFFVNSDNRIQSGTVKDGVTYSSEVFDCQTKGTTNTKFRSFRDSKKMTALTTLLFGQGKDTITLLIISGGIKIYQVDFFARIFKPRCKYYIADSKQIAKHFDPALRIDAESFMGHDANPKKYWHELLALVPGCNEDEKADVIIKAATAYAITQSHEKYDNNAVVLTASRRGKDFVVPSLSERSAFLEIPESGVLEAIAPASDIVDTNVNVDHTCNDNGNYNINIFQKILENKNNTEISLLNGVERPLKREMKDSMNHAFVNKLNFDNGAAALALDAWRHKIYHDPKRLEREKEACETIKKYLVLDLETTTTKKYKRVANPFSGDNWVVLAGCRDYNGTVFMNENYFSKKDAQDYDNSAVIKKFGVRVKTSKGETIDPVSLFLPLLDDYDVIVGHNIKFDLLYIWRDPELRRFLKRGGKIWDTMYGEYLLTGQQVRYGRGANLEDVARSYGGRTPKLDAVKQAWAAGKNTYEIPIETLKEYLHGDLENTELIFKRHLVRALEQRQVVICQARMDGILCITEMEYNGLFIDLDLAVKQANELNEKAILLKGVMNTLIPEVIPSRLRKHWNWASNQHMGYYFFGGDITISTGGFFSRTHLPRCDWGRHNLSDHNGKSVHLGPPNIITAPAECSVLSGGYTVDKATKTAKSYLIPYFAEGGFRKSSPWPDSVARSFCAVKHNKDVDQQKKQMVTDALINLIPGRYLILLVAGEIDAQSGIFNSLYFFNPITQESKAFHFSKITSEYNASNNSSNTVENIEEYLLQEARILTHSLIDSTNKHIQMWKPAEVLLFTRDAPISFFQAVAKDSRFERFLDIYHNNRATYDISAMPDMTVSFLDMNSALEYHRRSAKTTLILPELEIPKSTKKKTAYPFDSDLTIPATEWCVKYGNLLLLAAHSSFVEEEIVEKKLTKKQKENLQKDDATRPLLMRLLSSLKKDVPLMLGSPNGSNLKRYEILCFLGKMLTSNFDPFYVVAFPKEITYTIPGALHRYVSEKAKAQVIMNKFCSTATHILKVGNETLQYFEQTHNDSAAKAISSLRAMEKLIGTYYEFSEGGTGMVSLVHDTDNCIHHELVHIGTNTGRLSSSNPNCQNIPKEDKSPLREMFISRFSNGLCIEADYSQLEVVCLAALSGDKEMITDLQNNTDFHCKRVSMMRPELSYEEVVQRAKKNKEPDFVHLRQQAKIFSFQRQYGAGIRTISESTGLSPDQVKMLIEKEKIIYNGCDLFTNMVTLSANIYDATIQDGARNPDGILLHKGLFPVLTGTRYIFSESELPAVIQDNMQKWEKRTNFSPTILKNYPVQGFAAEIVQIILGRLWRHFCNCDNYRGRALLTNTVHDCVWIDTVLEITEQVAKDVDKIMSNAKNVLNELWPEIECVLDFPADVVVGKNLGHLKPLKELPHIREEIEKEKELKKVGKKLKMH